MIISVPVFLFFKLTIVNNYWKHTCSPDTPLCFYAFCPWWWCWWCWWWWCVCVHVCRYMCMFLCMSRGFKPTLGVFLNFSPTYLNFTFVFICVCLYVYGCLHATTHIWRSETTFRSSFCLWLRSWESNSDHQAVVFTCSAILPGNRIISFRQSLNMEHYNWTTLIGQKSCRILCACLPVLRL